MIFDKQMGFHDCEKYNERVSWLSDRHPWADATSRNQ